MAQQSSTMITALLVPLSFLVILVQSQTVGTQSLTQPTIPGCPVHVNGCSIPCDFPFVYKTKFINACNKHDVCYSCGVLYGWTRNNCDVAFKKDMHKVCEAQNRRKRFLSTLWKWIKNLATSETSRCKAIGDFYYKSVDLFGKANFETTSPAWCHYPCARDHGDPNKLLSV